MESHGHEAAVAEVVGTSVFRQSRKEFEQQGPDPHKPDKASRSTDFAPAIEAITASSRLVQEN